MAVEGSYLIAKAVLMDRTLKSASFKVLSKRTGAMFSFNIRRITTAGDQTIQVYGAECSGHNRLDYLGFYSGGHILKKGKGYSKAAEAIAWILRNIESGNSDIVERRVGFYHFGRCVKCGKKLKDPSSIKIGLGPTCRQF